MFSLSTIGSLIGLAIVFLPGLALGILIMWAIGRNRVAVVQGKPVPYPVQFNASDFVKAVTAAFTGNIDAMKLAFDKSIDIQFTKGDRLAWVIDAILDELVARSKDPTASMPMLDAAARWSGIPRDVFLTMAEHELRSRNPVAPTPPASQPVIAISAGLIALLLSLAACQPARAAYPIVPSSGLQPNWGTVVKGPQRFYQRSTLLPSDPPLMRDARGQLVAYEQPRAVRFTLTDQYGNVVHEHVAAGYQAEASIEPPEGTGHYQTTCDGYGRSYYRYGNGPWFPGKLIGRHIRNGGWFPGKLIGRHIANGGWFPGKLVGRHIRNGGWFPGKLVGRFLFRRRG